MPSPIEYKILLSVLAAVFLSLPVAILVRRFARKGPVAAGGVPDDWTIPPPPPPVMHLPAAHGPWAPPQSELLVPVPGLPMHSMWEKRDAWFAIGLALVVSMILGPLASGSSGSGESGSAGGGGEAIQFTPALFVVQLVFQAVLIGLVLWYLCGHRRFRAGSLFGLRQMGLLKTAGTALLWIVPGYVAIVLMAAITMPALQSLTGMELKRQLLVESAPSITDPLSRGLMFATLCAGAPLMEELIFRGVIFSVAARFLHRYYAIGVSAVFFAVVHNNLFSLVPLTLLGILFAVVYERTKSLAVPVLMHAIFNCSQYLLLIYGPKLA